MKAALIPPCKELKYFGNDDFHLLLSHLLTDYSMYRLHYKRRRRLGDYLVLDNSAHEFSAGESADILAQQAIDMHVQEVVVPDVLDDYPRTIEGALQAIETWVESESLAELSPFLMYVPQGKDEGDWLKCLNELVQIHCFISKHRFIKRDFTIGLSKDYEKWPGGLMHLIERHLVPLRETLAYRGIRMRVHLLGWGRELWSLKRISTRHKWIRSTDSAKPFVYAMKKIRLETNYVEPYPKRPANYFNKRMTPLQRDVAIWNINKFRWAATP